MIRKFSISRISSCAGLITLAACLLVAGWKLHGQESPSTADLAPNAAEDDKTFQDAVQPLLKKYCFRCHNVEKMKSGVQSTSSPAQLRIDTSPSGKTS